MTIETDLFTTLKTLVSNRVYPETFVQPSSGALPSWPSIRYSFISDVRPITLCLEGLEDTADVRIQLDVVDKTFMAMRALRINVIAAMRSFSPPAVLQEAAGQGGYDDATKTYRATLDYLIQSSSLPGSP